MANPGHDIYNMQADDVLSPKRQQEMAQLIEVLKKFHPTRMAVESDVGSQRVEKGYADYLAGKYTLSRTRSLRSDTGWRRSLATRRYMQSCRR